MVKKSDEQPNRKRSKTNHNTKDEEPVGEILPNIPNELATEVFKRLPAKSLSRFKCVKKSWLSFISDPHLIRAHLEEFSKNNDHDENWLVFATLDDNDDDVGDHDTKNVVPRLSFKTCSVRSAIYASSETEVIDLDLPKESMTLTGHKQIVMAGSCNGLVCVVIGGEEMYLWNPSSRISIKLPHFGTKTRATRPHYLSMSYGFGYDACNDDYKVVGVSCVSFVGNKHTTLAKIYSGKTNSWKRMSHFKDRIRDNLCYFLNGKLHWTAGRGENEPGRSDAGRKILTLDLANEKCGVIEQPCYGGAIFQWTLGLLGGCLSLSALRPSDRMDIWVMREYEVKESWEKLISLPYHHPIGGLFIKPVCQSKDGKIVFYYGTEMPSLVLYNPQAKSMNDIEFDNMEDFVGVEVYIESLVLSNALQTGKKKSRNRHKKWIETDDPEWEHSLIDKVLRSLH